MDFIIEVFGWLGMVIYLGAYALVSLKKTESDSVLYQGLNIFGGVLFVIYALNLKAYASAGLNFAWILIGIFTLGKKYFAK